MARDARELAYASGGCETGGDGTNGISSRDQGQCGGVRVREGSGGPVAAEHIAARGGGAVAGDPGGKSVTACPRRAGMTLFTSAARAVA
jgi:hypothetical protein